MNTIDAPFPTKDKLVDDILAVMAKTKGFPALAATVSKVLDTLQEDSVNLSVLVSTITDDFSLTQKVLKLVNSSMFADFGRDVTTVSRAVQLIGFDAVSHLAVSLKVLDTITSAYDPKNEGLEKALLAAEIVKLVCKDDEKESAAISSLVLNLGTLMFSKYVPEEYEKVKVLVAKGSSVDSAATAILGMTFNELGAEIATRWGFPKQLIGAIDGTGDTRLLTLARFSTTASSLIVDKDYVRLTDHLSAAEGTGIDIASLDTFVKANTTGNVQVTALRDPLPAGVVTPITLEAALTGLVSRFETSPYRTLDRFAPAILRALLPVVNAERILVFTKTPANDFVIKYGVGLSVEEMRAKVKISNLSPPTLFQAVIVKNVNCILPDIDIIKKSALPEGYDPIYYKVKSLVLLPMVVDGKVVSLLYIDWKVNSSLSPTEVLLLKKVRDLLVNFLPKL